jgi:8-oxo-dGTP pyrophosphatase MutT (NUDIX family)
VAAERFIVIVEVALVRDGRFLMTVRSEQMEHAGGTLCFPGGGVDWIGPEQDVLEATAARELLEEVGMTAVAPFIYVESHSFEVETGQRVLDVVLLARADAGEPSVRQPEEVAAVRWMTAEEVAADPMAPPWTRESLRRAEEKRLVFGW